MSLLLYQYTSMMFLPNGGGAGGGSTGFTPPKQQSWYYKMTRSLLPRRKNDELNDCQRQDMHFLYSVRFRFVVFAFFDKCQQQQNPMAYTGHNFLA